MRDDTGGKDQTRLLRRIVNRSEKTTAGEISLPCVGIHRDLAQPGEVNYESAIAGTETRQAMPPTPDCGENSGGRGDLYRGLYVAGVRTACYQSRFLGDHAVPDGTGILVGLMSGPDQIAFESPSERAICLAGYVRHFLGLPSLAP